jgi:hypothetical protein
LPNTAALSIRDLKPLEKGGVTARRGFDFQDNVAAAFCLDMILSPHLIEVWCETQDDITLIHRFDGYEHIEFVQVKGAELNQLWTSALLCAGQDGSKSIVEKLLAQDRCSEKCSFRIVTLREVSSELKVLTYPYTSPERLNDQGAVKQICTEVCKRLKGVKSPNGNDGAFWVMNTLWEVRGPKESIRNANLLKLRLC